ncbi:hypothetical protein JCM8115_000506 [Rhodotorula mucilaginosa]|uniref:Uncharacterized protein n=1 Tax=Rhodotorula mucilaginosa TaxID=5537 RepID=A0A9P6W8T7_RHOMI|nr:hypothetical protein C6P46_005519 [Rhodotorula mucilaginosa]TKA55424.1 hypothetical protein B0A53_02350 [Rhodotorula sp. CCFEE 5036]
MPSFKSCLVSLALAALAFAPVNAATSTDAGLVARGEKAARAVKPSSALARRNAAAKALKKRAGRQSWGQRQAAQQAAPVSEAHASSSGLGAYTPGSAFLSTPQALAAAQIRCGNVFICNSRAPAPPANGINVCASGRCSYRCETGFAPGGPDGTQCVASETQCGTQTCAAVENGYSLCDAAGTACTYGCSQGFTSFASGDAIVCLNTQTDAANCGAPGNACPASYNGIGEAVCNFGLCRVACPAGYVSRSASTGGFYCYNGENTLVQS